MNLQADLAEGGREVGAELSSVNPTVSGKTPMMVSPALTPPNEEKEGGGVSGNRSVSRIRTGQIERYCL